MAFNNVSGPGRSGAGTFKVDGKWLLASVREQGAPSAASLPNLADLEWLIGDWASGGKSRKAQLTFKWIVNKKFIELAYEAQGEKGKARSGVQIIGQGPGSGELISWSFFANGGLGKSRWRPFRNGWIVESIGRMPDGTLTRSTYLISKTDDNSFTRKSVNKRLAGKRLKDTETVTWKRKTP